MRDVLYRADVSELKEPSVFARAYEACTPLRKAKIDRLQKQDDRVRSLGAGILLSGVLSDFGYDENDVRVTEYGKPYLKDNPLFFNLSHSGTAVLCAVSDSEIGCDVETARRKEPVVGLCTSEEKEWLRDHPDGFLRLWTRKEAYMKALGKGLSLRSETVSVPLTFDRPVYDGTFSFLDLSDENVYISVCIRKKTGNIFVKAFNYLNKY